MKSMPTQRHHLPRLSSSAYQGFAAVHWTLTTQNRELLPLSESFHQQFQLLLLHTLARGSLVCPIYCLMPDHLHMIWMGTSPKADQLISIAFFNTYLEPLVAPTKLQPQPFDHVLRQEEREQDAFQNACGYIRENPARAKLVTEAHDWPYASCMVPGYPKLNVHEGTKYWQLFARILTSLRATGSASVR